MLCAGQFLLELRNTCINLLLEFYQSFGNGAVQSNHGAGAVGLRTYSTELKAVTCEGEGAGTVTVGIINEQLRNLRNIHLHALFAGKGEYVILIGFLDVIQQFAHLLAQERRDNCWWSFVGAQTMSIGGAHDASLQQAIVLVNTHQGLYNKGGETQVLLSCLARSVQQYAVICTEAPVVVLTTSVNACKGFLVQQYAETVLTSHFLHYRHQQHVVIDGQISFLKDRSQLKLVGSNLVVASLNRNTQLQRFNLQLLHEGLNTFWDSTKVVVVHLLVLGRIVAHQGATSQQQVGTGCIKSFVYQEVLLLPTQVADYLLHLGVKVMANLGSSHIHSLQGAQQGSLVVKCLTTIRYKYGRNNQGIVHNEDGTCGIPSRITASLECATDTTAGEAGSIRFLLNQQLAAELLYHTALTVVFNE